MDQEPRKQQEEARAGAEKPKEAKDIAQQLAELDRVMTSVRESVERLKTSVRAPVGAAPSARAEGGEEEQREPEGEAEAGAEASPEEGAQPGEAGEAREGAGEEGAEEEEEGEEETEEKGKTFTLFDGKAESMGAWKKVGSGDLEHHESELHFRAGPDRGLAYYSSQRFDDFVLKARYRIDGPQAPAAVAIRFRDPEKRVPDRENPETKHQYDNQAYVAVHTGFEVQLTGGPGREAGTFAGIAIGESPGNQRQPQKAELKQGDWNELEIEARGQAYSVRLNGVETARFDNPDGWRGKRASDEVVSGYVGLLIGEPSRAARPAGRAPGPLPPQLSGPLVPGRAKAPKPGAQPGAGQATTLAIGHLEVRTLGPPPVSEEKVKEARRDLQALHQEVLAALARLKSKDKGLEGVLAKAYGYAVLPSVGRASLVLGAARGYGEVFAQGKPVGFTRLTQITIGVQVGGQTYTHLVVFGSKESLEMFKSSPKAFNANLAIAFVKGAAGTNDFKDVTSHAYSRGGMVLEGSLGGQKFRFLREDEAIREIAKSLERKGAVRTRFAQAGNAAKSLAGKVGGLFKKKDKGEAKAQEESEGAERGAE